MKAVFDHNLFAQHAVFGYFGTLNDINIWGYILLHRTFCDGSFAKCDFPFEIGGEIFESLWLIWMEFIPLWLMLLSH
jgi:hypothetical protein